MNCPVCRRFLIAIFGLGITALHGAEVPLVPQPVTQEILSRNGRLSLPEGARGQALDLLPEGGFAEGCEYTFRIRYDKSWFAFLTGRDYTPIKEAFLGPVELVPRAEVMYFLPSDSWGQKGPGILVTEDSSRIRHWQAKTSHVSLNHRMPAQTFATIDNVARWQEREAAALEHDLGQEDIRLNVSITETLFRFSVNGVFLRELSRNAADSLDGCVLRIQGATSVADRAEVRELPKGFLTLDISERLNASGLPGLGTATNLPAGGEIIVGGVPFRLPARGKFDHLDLSRSWMEAAMRCGYNATEVWSRWKPATDKVPLRYQFRVPFDNYEALYALAASDGSSDTIPRFTAQFYLPSRGRPVNFSSPDIPSFTAEAEVADSLTLLAANGKQARLYLVRVPLEPGQFKKFSASPFFDMELTKDVQTYRAYPDPLTHSIHGAGLPSSVRVFGITFGITPLKTTFEPGALANLWREGSKASYTVTLENATDKKRSAVLFFAARSYDGTDGFKDRRTVGVEPGEKREVRFTFQPARFGHYDLELVKEDSGVRQTFIRTMTHLRRRDFSPRPFDHKGMFFGCWWRQYSPEKAAIAGEMGLDGFIRLEPKDEETRAVMRQYGMKGYYAGGTDRMRGLLKNKTGNREEDIAMLRKALPEYIKDESDDLNTPAVTAIFSEPGGIGTGFAEFGEYYGEAPYHYTNLVGQQKERYESYKYDFMTLHAAVKPSLAETKILMPYGSWTFTIPFLQDPDTRNLIDGVSMDYQFYTRLPEQQIHQCAIHSMYYLRQAWEKFRPGIEPVLTISEGPDISQVYPGANTEETAAAHKVRSSIIKAGYGVNHLLSYGTSIDQAGGENHCSGGFLDNEVSLNPELSYSAFATLTRHMRDARFESYSDTGSYSAYCANFRNHKTGGLVRLIWTIRGTREFVIGAAPGALEVYDAMDNLVKPEESGGASVIKVGQMPLYVYGTADRSSITLGAADHSDAQPGQLVIKLGNAADLLTQQAEDADEYYADMMPTYIKRFPAAMEIGTEEADAGHGGKALSVRLPQQKIDRYLMPYFTCLKPAKPIPIQGKASHILVWAKGASDWGRIVYVMRDAKGKLWYSTGMKGTWNADDMPGDSVFCFDGWRLLRYEMPANAPWDSFRELGMTCWGSESEMNLVELPLSLEKVFIERRSSVMYGNEACRIPRERPVLLGDILVEYATESDMTDEAVRLSRVRAPEIPAGALPNPIAEMKKNGTLPAGRITGVKDPDTWFDGTRGVFSFEMPTNAVAADIWMSLHPDGRGALKQGGNFKASPAQVSGFLAGTEFYAFLVYKDKEGNTSTPSEPFKFKLEDHFAHQ